GGLQMVPAAIVHGFILSLVVPIPVSYTAVRAHETGRGIGFCGVRD
ncbi:hypothetical protein ACVGW2_14610, partial [Enterobacter intestinihominis]